MSEGFHLGRDFEEEVTDRPESIQWCLQERQECIDAIKEYYRDKEDDLLMLNLIVERFCRTFLEYRNYRYGLGKANWWLANFKLANERLVVMLRDTFTHMFYEKYTEEEDLSSGDIIVTWVLKT